MVNYMDKELPIDGIIALFQRETANKGEIDALDVVKHGKQNPYLA